MFWDLLSEAWFTIFLAALNLLTTIYLINSALKRYNNEHKFTIQRCKRWMLLLCQWLAASKSGLERLSPCDHRAQRLDLSITQVGRILPSFFRRNKQIYRLCVWRSTESLSNKLLWRKSVVTMFPIVWWCWQHVAGPFLAWAMMYVLSERIFASNLSTSRRRSQLDIEEKLRQVHAVVPYERRRFTCLHEGTVAWRSTPN